MIFKSKIIYDPGHARPNKLGHTVGLVFYTPKYWSCKDYDFYANYYDSLRDDRPLSEDEMERRYLSKKAHENCRHKHLSYPGYMYWMGPKRRYNFRYMGPTHSRESWWKPFSVYTHGRYVRLLDNGPQSPSNSLPLNDVKFREWRRVESERVHDAMERARQQMLEYEAKREGRA